MGVEPKMARWLLIAVALCALATVADADCTLDDVVKINNCVETNNKALEINSASTSPMTQYEAMCQYYQDTLACYPCCYCKESEYAATRAEVEKTASDSLKVIDPSKTCQISGQCGKQHGGCSSYSSSAGLRAGAVTTLLVAAFALLAYTKGHTCTTLSRPATREQRENGLCGPLLVRGCDVGAGVGAKLSGARSDSVENVER